MKLEPTPRVEKIAVIERALTMMDATTNTIIETGTGHGDLACLLRNLFDRVVTIELSESFVEKRQQLYGGMPKVEAITEDSRAVLPVLAREIDEPAVWFLDAHYCHLRTMAAAGGHAEMPLMEELSVLAARPYEDIVIVDDVHAFNRRDKGGDHAGGGWQGVNEKSIAKQLGRVRTSYVDTDCFVMIRSCET